MKLSRLALHLLLVLTVLAPAFGERPNAQPIDRSQLMAWMAGGISSNRLVRLVAERGVAFGMSAADEKQLRAAGADTHLVQILRSAHPVANAKSKPSSAALAKAAELAHQKKYDAAVATFTDLVRSDADNASLHFALGEMLLMQEQPDKALDEFTEAARLMPSFPETHNRLSYIFYRSEDADNAIAEARTALSIDTGNAEAYRYLGLGLYGAGKYRCRPARLRGIACA